MERLSVCANSLINRAIASKRSKFNVNGYGLPTCTDGIRINLRACKTKKNVGEDPQTSRTAPQSAPPLALRTGHTLIPTSSSTPICQFLATPLQSFTVYFLHIVYSFHIFIGKKTSMPSAKMLMWHCGNPIEPTISSLLCQMRLTLL